MNVFDKIEPKLKELREKMPQFKKETESEQLEDYKENVGDKDIHSIIMEQKNYGKKGARGYKYTR